MHPIMHSNHGPGEILARAEALGFPRVTFRDGARVLDGETDWRERIRGLFRAELRELDAQLAVLEQRATTGARK